jgi:hypothetical protein
MLEKYPLLCYVNEGIASRMRMQFHEGLVDGRAVVRSARLGGEFAAARCLAGCSTLYTRSEATRPRGWSSSRRSLALCLCAAALVSSSEQFCCSRRMPTTCFVFGFSSVAGF